MYIHPSLKVTIRFVVSSCLLLGLVYVVGVDRLLQTLKRLSLQTVITVLLLYYFGVLISVLRWSVFLRAKGTRLPVRRLCGAYLVGAFLNNFLPTSFGGDVSKLYSLRGKSSGGALAATILLERAVGMSVLIALGIVSSALMWSLPGFRTVALLGCGLLGAIAIVGLALGPTASQWCGETGIAANRPKILGKIKTVLCELLKNEVSSYGWTATILLSLIFVLQGALANHLYFSDLGASVALHQVVVGLATVQLLGLIPFTINGIGATEGAYVALFGLFGITAEISLSVALIARVMRMTATLPGGLILMLTKQSTSVR